MIKEGIAAVYKPKGPTSHDVINELRRLTGIQKIGHAGTLDPLARGVLVVGIGAQATQKLHALTAQEKEYIAVIRLGAESTTDDEEGDKKECPFLNSQFPKKSDVEKIVSRFVGKIQQTPPIYSALKIKGTTAYARVRRGEKVTMQPREVEIKEIKVVSYVWPNITLRVVTGPGVYIRALARDVGRALGTGGYVADLERTRVGEFTKDTALMLEGLV